MMKGFPNQVADLQTLAKAMDVLIDLLAAGNSPRRDDVFGEALIRRGVLRTGHTPIPVDEYLAEQKANRRASDQSFRTRARGLRELFRVMSLIDDSGGDIAVSSNGRQVAALAKAGLSPQALRLWRRIIRNMVHDGGDGECSHPYQVLLRLVAKRPGTPRAKCALALEAKNDTERELERIVSLSDMEESRILGEIHVTKSNWDNAKKILPRFAEQLGDVRTIGHRFFLSDAPGKSGETPGKPRGTESTKGPRRPRSATAVTAASIAKTPMEADWDEVELDAEAVKMSTAKLKSRLKRHNLLVQELAEILESEGADLFENPFDCLACYPAEGLLIEAKSLDGTERDEISRVRDALAQLLYYESFVTQPLVQGKAVTKVACFEAKISDKHIDWLRASDINVIWPNDGGFTADDDSRQQLAGHLCF